jgi:hypothetical protein
MERIFATSGDWALGSDDIQWILYRRRSKTRGGWHGVSFVRSERDILARCMREKGCGDDAAVLLEGLPATFDEWKRRPVTALIDAGSDPEPTSYFQLQQQRRPNPGEEKVSSDISTLPPQPAESPWSGDPCGDEPLIDRSEDAVIISTEGE